VVQAGARTPHARGLGPWLSRSAPKSARGEVTLAIVTDARIRALNRQFRGKDAATDVLSFPVEGATGRAESRERRAKSGKRGAKSGGRRTKGKGQNTLGDIVIARGVAARQARALGHSLLIELRVLALHGLLHLLGYDHEVDEGRMARVETRLRRRAGLPGGLIARSS
jgi:probable rRNA maturation factor